MIDRTTDPDPVDAQNPQGTLSAEPSWFSRRMLILFIVLIVLLCLYPVVRSRLQDWRHKLAGDAPREVESSEAQNAVKSAEDLTGSATGSSPPVATEGAFEDRPPVFAELPESWDERLPVLKEEAVRTADQLVERFPQEPRPLGLLAMTYNRFGEAVKAEELWRQCLAINPRYAEAYANLGNIAKARGDYQQAAEHLKKALDVDPGIPDVRTDLGDTLMNLMRISEAVPLLEEEVRRFPASLVAQYHLGQARLQLKEYEKAITSFEEAIRLDPQCAYAYYGLANAHRRLGQTEKSVEYMKKFKQYKATDLRTQRDVTKKFDDEGEVRRTLAAVHTTAGNICAEADFLRSAEAHWLRAIEIFPQDTTARYQLATFYDRQNRLNDVVSIFQALRAVEPGNPMHCLNLGTAHLRRNDLDAAEKAYRTALEVAPEAAVGYATLAGFLLRTRTGHALAEARALVEKAVELEPTGQYWALLSAVTQQLGDSQAALAAIERACALDPDNRTYPQIRFRLQQLNRKVLAK
ncbi:MAG: tetratricopeptide repeat protein [Pirellulaceae bacterium]